MRSTLVEFARMGELGTGAFRKRDPYLRMIEGRPIREVEMSIDHRDFEESMRDLRYDRASEAERQEALESVFELSSNLLRKEWREADGVRTLEDGALLGALDEHGGALQQIDLVANASELSAVPFECALDDGGEPLFRRGGGVVVTRRVRGDFAETDHSWPTKPRLLFAWSAAGGAVPRDDHRNVLRSALDRWMPATAEKEGEVFVELPNVKRSELAKALEGGGFTHVHLLAHGATMRGGNSSVNLCAATL